MGDSTSLHRCETLVSLLGADKVLLPGSTGYNTSLSSYFSPQAAAVHPVCFVTPQTVTDVSTVVKSLASPDNGGPCDFAVRSGGHTWFANANSAPGGITIDMRGLNSVDLSADKSSVSVGTGATWDAVYGKLDPLGLSVAGGRVAGVGVGGLTLGGGISYFGPREGFTCNQATSFEVVLADGSVVEANEKQNADLWWGLRGGSNNFGIVTRVDLTTFEQGLLWSSMTLNPLTEVDNQAKIYAELMAAENYDVNASFLTGWAFASQQGLSVTLNQLVYTRPVGNETPAFYKPILDLPAISNASATTVVANMSTLAQNSVALQQPQAARYMTATTTFVPTEAMIRATYDAFNASLSLLQNVTGLMWAVNIETLPPQLYTHRGADTNALGLGKRRNDTLVVCLVSPSWSDAAQDEQVYSAARSLMADIEAKAKNLGVYDPYIYLDYAAPWQEVIKGYGAENIKKLQDLRKRVDPKEVFTRNVKGGFKIPEGQGS
ncbi:putative oxidoreductase [Camillea tinctor]|nr:putative oxidoreductase [Camillea tinctor]